MDKNKSRTDLLAAGRKKLQQFRQKKDEKGGSSHGKSSKRSSKTEHHESDAEASATLKKAGLPEVLEGEKQNDSRSGTEYSSKDHSVAPDVDEVAVDPLPISMTQELGVGETTLARTAELCMQEVGFHENYIDSSDPKERESSQASDDNVAQVSSFGIPDVPDPKVETQPDDLCVGTHVSVPSPVIDATDRASVVLETESISRDKEMELQSPGEDAIDMTSLPAKGDQEADGSDSNKFGSRGEIEIEENLRLTSSEQDETVERAALEKTDTKVDSQLKQIGDSSGLSISASTIDMSNHILPSTAYVSEAPGNVYFTNTLVSEHGEDVRSVHSNVEEPEMPTTSNPLEIEREEGYQGDRMIIEASDQQNTSDDSFVFVGKIHEAPLLNKSANSSSGCTKLSSQGVCKISLSHLAEIINGLNEEEYNLLLKLRGSSSDTEFGTEASISLQYAVPDVLDERLKEELILANCTKDILNLQLIEHIDLQTDSVFHIQKLETEMSLLHDELREACKRRECLAEELEKCRSELQTAIGGRDELQNQINVSKAEVDEVSARAHDFQNHLESSKSELLILSKELDEYRDLVAALQLENKNLNDTLALLTDENKNVVEEKDSCLLEIEKLLKELADCKKLVSAFQESSNATEDACSHHIPGMQDGEGNNQDELFVREVFDDSFALMKRQLEKAEELSQKLEKAIEGLHCHLSSANKSADKVGTPAVSKLIRAFESKAHLDESDVDRKAVTEEQSPMEDLFVLMKEQIGNLITIVKGLIVDNENASLAFKVEQDVRNSAELTIGELKGQFEALKEHSDNTEAANLELLVLFEAIRQHSSGIKEKYIELEVFCRTLKQQDSGLRTKNSGLGAKLQEHELRIKELQNQLNDLQKNSDETSSALRDQLENFQKEVAEKDLKIKQEQNSTFSQILESVEGLYESVGLPLTRNFTLGDASLDISGHVAASITAAINMIEELKGNQEVTQTAHQATINMLNEVNDKYSQLLRERKGAYETLHRLYHQLRNPVFTSSGTVEDKDYGINRPDENVNDPVDYAQYESLTDQLQNLLDERLQLHLINNKLNTELVSIKKEIEELNTRSLDLGSVQKLVDDIEVVVRLEDDARESDGTMFSRLEALVVSLLHKYKEVSEQISSSREELGAKVMELKNLQEDLHQLTALNIQHENEILLLKEHLSQVKESFSAKEDELQEKISEVEQSEQRIASIREKLSIAVAKGKGLVVQRDSLKQSLAETSSELERLLEELHLKDVRLHELETRLRTYSEAGERVEALESELSYIRNSATALRESFLLKDSVMQRVEEILEDLDLPEHFHAGGIIEKVEWLARSVTGNSLPAADWDQKSSVGGSFSDTGMVVMDALKENVQPGANFGDDLIRKYEELQNKFYGLAEQNEMLEQSLMERNQLVQRWEELLEGINLPSHLRSAEPENTIEWLGKAISEASNDRNSLLQRIDSLEKHCGSLAGELEDSKKSFSFTNIALENSERRISDLETEIQTILHEREDLSQKLEILVNDNQKLSEVLSQASFDKSSLLERIDALENQCASLVGELEDSEKKISLMTADLENSQRRIFDLEIEIQAVVRERELISGKLETLTRDNEKLSQNSVQFELDNQILQNEVASLREKLLEKLGYEDIISSINTEISRLQDMICEALQAPGLKDSVSGGSTECLEEMLRKLIEVYTQLSVAKSADGDIGQEHQAEKNEVDVEGDIQELNSRDSAIVDVNVLKQELEDALNELKYVKEDRDRYIEKQQSLVSEVEALEKQKVDLQELLNQEMQKCASVKEKLNVAVRKGKSVVQQRDSLKQTIEELNAELEHLKSEIKHEENTLAEYEQKTRDLATYSESTEALESENVILRNRLAETEHLLHEIEHILTVVLSSLGNIDADGGICNSNPIEKLQYINSSFQGLRDAVALSEREAGKSRRAAELLLAELNEVQDRNDALQEEIAQATQEFVEISKQRDIVETARVEALSHLEKLSKDISEEKKKQYSDLVLLKSAAVQLKKSFSEISHLAADLFPKDLEFLHNLEAGMLSCLNREAANQEVDVPILSRATFANAEKENISDSSGHHSISVVCGAVQELTKEVAAMKEVLHEHSIIFSNKATNLSRLMEVFHEKTTSQRDSLDSTKKKLKHVESVSEEKDREMVILRKNVAFLFEACTSSLMEIANIKAQVLTDVVAGDQRTNLKLRNFSNFHGGGESNILSEENVKIIAEELLSSLKDFATLKGEIIEGNYKEMKITISNLQKELQEKDIQRETICRELVTQIKEAEAAVTNYSRDLESSNSRVHNLEKQVEVLEKERALLEEKLKELRDGQVNAIELESKITSLTGLIATKDQEIEALTQALDEEDDQIEDLTKKMSELEKIVERKNIDIHNLESSRGKVLKKLSVTVSKFDELHHFSESLLAEVEKLQSQLQDRDAEVSFLRQEVTRCTNDVLAASQSSRRSSDEFCELLTWMNSLLSEFRVEDPCLDDGTEIHEYKEMLKEKIASILSKIKDLHVAAQNRDELLQIEKSKVEELRLREEYLQKSLLEKESQLNMLEEVADSGRPTSAASNALEIEPVINKWTVPGTSGTSQVRSLRKANNDQVAIAIDMDPDGSSRLDDEDDDKVHGFKSLTRSRIVPRFARPVTDMIDGLWVSCDRALMRHPTLRLCIIMYWAVVHALLVTFVI